jgi:hypothetical protein
MLMTSIKPGHTIHNSEKCLLSGEGEIGIIDIEFNDAVKMIMVLRISRCCLRKEYEFVVLECCTHIL